VLLLLLLLQLSDYKAGSCRADLEELRAAARAQQGLEPDSDEVRRVVQNDVVIFCSKIRCCDFRIDSDEVRRVVQNDVVILFSKCIRCCDFCIDSDEVRIVVQNDVVKNSFFKMH
jgi:hypothetical protein